MKRKAKKPQAHRSQIVKHFPMSKMAKLPPPTHSYYIYYAFCNKLDSNTYKIWFPDAPGCEVYLTKETWRDLEDKCEAALNEWIDEQVCFIPPIKRKGQNYFHSIIITRENKSIKRK